MGTVVLVDEQLIPASPECVFDLFGREIGGGWFFAANCSSVHRGMPVRFDLPVLEGRDPGGLLEGTGRIVEVRRPARIVVLHETPWRGRVTCTIRRVGEQSRVRVVVELPEGALRWHLRHRGAFLAPEVQAGETGIGLLVSLSGALGMVGAGAENLAALAVDEVNSEGSPGGRPVRLVVADDCTSPVVAAVQARRLVEDERCPVVIASVTSPSFEAVRSVVEKAGAVLVYSLANEGGAGGPLTFRLGERPDEQVGPAVESLSSRHAPRRWYLAGNGYCWPQAVHASARRAIAESGGEVAGEGFCGLEAQDFSRVLESVDRAEPDVVLSTFVGAACLRFDHALRQSGLGTRSSVVALGFEDLLREHAGAPVAGTLTVRGYFKDLPMPENRAFLARHRAQFGDLAPPPSALSEGAYEAVHLVAAAARAAGGWEPQDVARRLLTASFDGPRGPVSVRRRRVPQVYLAEATGGGFTVHDEVPPRAPRVMTR